MNPEVTIVVPTFNEADNVVPLVDALVVALGADGSWEVLFVDDSTDHTPDVVRRAGASSTVPVRLLHREPGDRVGGLSGAVVAGLREARGETVVVMDGDLQHPAGTVPLLLAALRDHDVAVASRYVGDGAAEGLDGLLRHAVSTGSTRLARALFPRRLRDCSDPMTGFFAVRRAALDLEALEPRGFKILLEILARHPMRVAEVPFVFGERLAGESKASLRQGVVFLWQLVHLRCGRIVPFGLVGLSGVVVNLVLMSWFLAAGLHYLSASIVATEAAIVTNFVLQERVVFRDLAGSVWRRFRLTWVFNNVEQLCRLPLLVLAIDVLTMAPVPAQGATLVIAFGARYAFVTRFVYPRLRRTRARREESLV